MGKRSSRSRGRNRSGNRNRGQNQSQNQKQNQPRSGGSPRARTRREPFDPEKHFMPAPVPEREYDVCPVSGEEIDDIVTALAEPYSGRPARFDRVIEKIRASEEIGEDERLAYLGKGAFGIVSIQTGENGRPELTVRKRIQYEDSHEKYSWRRELAPGISRDYVPQPEPLSDLYSREELEQFPRFDATGASYARS
ncbi:MAG: hypothetical protein ACOCYB_10285 [Alkalispirochaeta sp.]